MKYPRRVESRIVVAPVTQSGSSCDGPLAPLCRFYGMEGIPSLSIFRIEKASDAIAMSLAECCCNGEPAQSCAPHNFCSRDLIVGVAPHALALRKNPGIASKLSATATIPDGVEGTVTVATPERGLDFGISQRTSIATVQAVQRNAPPKSYAAGAGQRLHFAIIQCSVS